MNAYSYWEQGRDIGSGQIVSMTPIEPGSSGELLGNVTLGGAGLALSAIAQFGIFLELRRANHLKEAQFEERRHGWISDITTQWIHEHSSGTGIRRDVTMAVSQECEKMWEKVCENQKVDVPQSLLLRLSRMCEFLEWNYALVSTASNRIAIESESDKDWLFDANASPEDACHQLLSEAVEETRGSWWQGLLKTLGGLPLFLIPGVGPIAGGGAVGYGIGEMIGCLRTSDADMDVLRDKVALLRFGIAASYLESAAASLEYLLENQEFDRPQRYVALERQPNKIDFLLEPVQRQRFSLFRRKHELELRPIPIPKAA